MSPDYRRGWHAAMVASARHLRAEAVSFKNADDGKIFLQLAIELEQIRCPHTLSITDEAGNPLVKP